MRGFWRACLIVAIGCGASAPPTSAPHEAPTVESEAPEALEYESEPVTLSPEPDRWPTPPRQGADWRPPANADPVLVEAARLLFDELGAPDPRGLERRWVAITVRHIWGDAREARVQGWVLPDLVDGRRFVIAPDGLLYLAHAVMPASFEPEPTEEERPFLAAAPAITEAEALVTLAFRVRAGEPLQLPEPPESDRERRWRGTPSAQQAANDWAWAQVERAITAHMQGDDPLSLRDLQVIERLHGEHLDAFDPRNAGFDSALPLVADQTRRARERVRDGAPRLPRPDDAPRETRGDVAVRVMGLIRELDQVHARQWGQPGGVNLADDPVVQELIVIGDPAVEPLLDVLESDTRMTRSVHFWRDFARSRTVLGVHEAAYAAIATILERNFFSVASTGDNLTLRGMEGRREMVRVIREYWQHYGALSLHERWYAALANDQAGLDEWARAASLIVTPSNVSVRRGSMMGTTWTSVAAEGDPPPPHGESLRSGHDPSVAALLSRRITATVQAGELDQNGCSLARAAAMWDRRATRRAFGGARASCFESSCPCLPELVDLSADERGVLRRYARWLRSFEPTGESVGWALHAAASHRDRTLDATIDALFRETAWVDAAVDAFTVADGRALVRIPAVRRAFAERLGDCAAIGEITAMGNGGFSYSHDRGGGSGGYGEDPDSVPEGTVMPLRRCDLLADQIARATEEESMRYRLDWSEAKRDAELTELKEWLRREP